MSKLLFEDELLLAPAGSQTRFGTRWRLVSAGLSNVWRYGDLVLPAASGRLLLRGPNGTGKTTALEALWPFLLDLDRTKLPAGRSRTTTLTSLMRENHHDRKRIGYAWLTFAGPGEEGDVSYGARLAFSNGSTPNVKVQPFRIPGRPLDDLPLTKVGRTPYSTAEEFREAVEAVGGITFNDEPEYVAALAGHVFGTDRESLAALAHRVRQVRNPSLLAETSPSRAAEAVREALPGVASEIIEQTAEALAATDETRAAFERDANAARRLTEFAAIWQQYAAEVTGRFVTAAEEAHRELAAAGRAARSAAAEHTQAMARAQAASEAYEAAERSLRATETEIESITRSPEYATAGRLTDLQQAADAQTRAAKAQAANLGNAARMLVGTAGRALSEARRIAEGMESVALRAAQADARATTPGFAVHTRPQGLLTVGDQAHDPGPLLELPTDLDQLSEIGRQWAERHAEHERRQAGADLMLTEHHKVAAAQSRAERASDGAERAEAAADQAVQLRDQRSGETRQAAALLARAITGWAAQNPDLTADPDSDPLGAEAIAEVAEEEPAVLLAAASDWRQAAVDRSAEIAAGLESHARERDRQARELAIQADDCRVRAKDLRAGKELLPDRPTWAGKADHRAFGNALRWREGLLTDEHALVESALLAAGILGATLTEGGLSGEAWAVTADAPPAEGRTLAELIEADPAHPLAVGARAVLERIALADTVATAPSTLATVIARDGGFRLGALTGHAPGYDDPADLPAPRHIGAARRRAAALAEAERLEAEAVALDETRTALQAEAAALREDAGSARLRAAEFPDRAPLREAERQRAAAATAATTHLDSAHTARVEADQAQLEARQLAAQWTAAVRDLNLPIDPAALTVARDQAKDTAQTLRGCVREFATHHDRALALRQVVADLAQERQRLTATHADAVAAHDEAERAQLIYDKLEAEQGQAAAELTTRLGTVREQARTCRSKLKTAAEHKTAAAAKEAAAEVDARHAAERVAEREPPAREALVGLAQLVAVPDVAESLLGGEPAASGEALIEQVKRRLTSVATSGRRKLTETYEEARAHLSGLWAIDRADHHADLDTYRCSYDGAALTPAAAAELARSVEERARTQLEEAEESALRDFIIGRLPTAIGVAWTELQDWVEAVNRKMEHASASSGVGVRVKVPVRDDLSPHQRAVHRLACRKSASARTNEDDATLAEALKQLLATADAETVTERVEQAVDIRQWVRVEYWIHRPDQEPKRWTGRTGLSSGERRLVILAPMLASIAALHDSFPATALRLAALDEVPTEVDEQGREGLARYLAELDLDVICTSYLWDGAPGAWDGIEAYDLEAMGDIVVGLPMLVRGLALLPGDEDLPR